jgi:DNA-directed RNA polymerase specialized sigma24 family protein
MTENILHTESPVGLREFVKENEEKLCQFLNFMLFGFSGLEEVTLKVFRSFGDFFQKQTAKKSSDWEKVGLRIQLFSIAWKAIVKAQNQIEYNWSYGRDTRPLKQLDIDLLSEDRSYRVKKVDPEIFLPRLARVDIDFRAPMVLRDVLNFDDEEILRILEIRWGVYRHRLHRGRLAFRESLKGRQNREA